MSVRLEWRGVKQLETALKELGPKIASRLGDGALRAGARIIVREAKRLAPKRTGELRRSIVVRVSPKRRSNERAVVIGFTKPASRRAHLIEYGTSHSAPQPFIRPAMDSKANEALAAMGENLRKGIAREEYKRSHPPSSEE
jgi:HK97 gp10 family phage protein